jgi:hypothetical protein
MPKTDSIRGLTHHQSGGLRKEIAIRTVLIAHYCPLTDAADVLIYDPSLVALDASGAAQNLAVESALAHPDLPMLATTFTPAEAEAARSVIARAKNVALGARDRLEMLVQVNQLVGAHAGDGADG